MRSEESERQNITGARAIIAVVSLAITMTAVGYALLFIKLRAEGPLVDVYMVPDGYVGWVQVIWAVNGAPPIPTVGRRRFFMFPAGGKLYTSSAADSGWNDQPDEVYYYSGTVSKRLTIPDGPDEIAEEDQKAPGRPIVRSRKIFIGDPMVEDVIHSDEVGPVSRAERQRRLRLKRE